MKANHIYQSLINPSYGKCAVRSNQTTFGWEALDLKEDEVS